MFRKGLTHVVGATHMRRVVKIMTTMLEHDPTLVGKQLGAQLTLSATRVARLLKLHMGISTYVLAVLLAGCANRGMEAPSGAAGAGGGSTTGGHGGALGAGGSGGNPGIGGFARGGSAGQVAVGTGGITSTGGTGGTSTGGSSGGSGGQGGESGQGAAGTAGGGEGGVAGRTGMGGSGGVVGSGGGGGKLSSGGAGGAAGSGGAGGIAGGGGAGGRGLVVISVDFVGGSTAAGGAGGLSPVSAPAMDPTETAGAKPAANWNSALSISGTLANLRESDGTATTASVSWNSPANGTNPGEWVNGFADAPGDTRMMNGYLDPTSSALPATIKVTGLPSAVAGGYDVYVYVQGSIPSSSSRTYQYAIGSTAVTISQTGPSPSTFSAFTPAASGGTGNYVIFRSVSGTTFTLIATPGTGTQTRAPVNGIQIVWPSGS